MLNKKVLLGSLVAGAFLLPMAANAGVVSGPCVNCHTMHQTDGSGNVRVGGLKLMGGTSCEGCHAQGANDPDGKRAVGSFRAPQVGAATSGAPNLAGYFTPLGGAAYDSNQHNITADLTGMQADGTDTTAPGAVTIDTNTTCSGCHGGSTSGHHGAASSYRFLFALPAVMTADSTYGNSTNSMPTTVDTTYSATAMNGFCANCHGYFHGVEDQTPGGVVTGAWIRHPTDISLTAADTATMASYDYTNNYAAGGQTTEDMLPLGTNSSTETDAIMCITCHFSHGGPNDELLRFDYALQTAGGAVPAATPGCETCHNYGGAPQLGM